MFLLFLYRNNSLILFISFYLFFLWTSCAVFIFLHSDLLCPLYKFKSVNLCLNLWSSNSGFYIWLSYTYRLFCAETENAVTADIGFKLFESLIFYYFIGYIKKSLTLDNFN